MFPKRSLDVLNIEHCNAERTLTEYSRNITCRQGCLRSALWMCFFAKCLFHVMGMKAIIEENPL